MEIAVFPESAPCSVRIGTPLLVFGKSVGRVSYRAELSGETAVFSQIAAISKAENATTVALLETENYGVLRRSAVIAERGTLLGVTDELSAPEHCRASASLRVYKTAVGNLGLLVGRDLFAYEPAHALSLCDSDLIVHLSLSQSPQTPLLTAALAYLCGVPVLSLSGEIAHFALSDGTLSTTPKNGTTFSFNPQKSAYPVTVLRRGLGVEEF